MQRFRADSLSFTGPDCWADVTLGQFLTLNDDDAPNTEGFIITTLCDVDEATFRQQRAPFDLSAFVLNNLSFLTKLPEVPEHLPKSLTIDGKTVKLPKDLGASALLGQMWDVDLVIKQRQKQKLPVDPASMADVVLPVFLWPLLSDEPYTDRHEAMSLWPRIANMSCVDGLAASGFFLRTILSPESSGKISSQPLLKTPLKSWRQLLHRVLTFLRMTTPLSS